MAATLPQLLDLLIANSASDLHLLVGNPPMVRIDGMLHPVQGELPLTPDQTHDFVLQLLTEPQRKEYETSPDLDFSYQYQNKARFRVNVYRQQGSAAASMRLIPPKIPTVEELQLPAICRSMAHSRTGLVLVTGPTGSGKSSTLAAIINEINQERSEHILTIEDPIEFIHKPVRSIFSQREVGHDTSSWAAALRSGLREDPDVVLIGEMRDLETISAAITMAETGHLVFGTLHTNSGPETIGRVIDAYPEHQQSQIRQQLSTSLRAVLSQRLLLRAPGRGRIAAIEALINIPAVSNLIREGKTFQLDSVMQTSSEAGMMLLEAHLGQLVNNGTITVEEAKKNAIRPAELARVLGL